MLDAAAHRLLDFNVIVVSDVVLEWSHLVNDERVRLRQRCSGLKQFSSLQIHALERFVMLQQRPLHSAV